MTGVLVIWCNSFLHWMGIDCKVWLIWHKFGLNLINSLQMFVSNEWNYDKSWRPKIKLSLRMTNSWHFRRPGWRITNGKELTWSDSGVCILSSGAEMVQMRRHEWFARHVLALDGWSLLSWIAVELVSVCLVASDWLWRWLGSYYSLPLVPCLVPSRYQWIIYWMTHTAFSEVMFE